MRPLALIGLCVALVLAGVSSWNVSSAARRHREAQDHALEGALSSVVGRVVGSERQMATAASQMLVNPAVEELLGSQRLPAALRRADMLDAEQALLAFQASAIVPVSSACIDDGAARQVVCDPGAHGVIFPQALRRAFAAVAARTTTGQPTTTFRSPVDGARSGSFVVPMREGSLLRGVVHFDMADTTVDGSSLLVRDIPGVRVRLTQEPSPSRGAMPHWSMVTAGHLTMVADLPLPIGTTGRTLAIAATSIAPNPDFANGWDAGALALLGLAVFILVGSIAALAISGRRMRRELTTDPLTRLYNRRALMEDLPRVCQRASEEDPAFLWFFDLNGFKNYNDAFGHAAGDVLLARLGRRLEEAVGTAGAVYRLGGDEFCVLLWNPVEDPHALFQRSREALAERGGAFTVTASAGAVEIPSGAREPSHALRLADQHMYRDKAALRGGAAEVITAVLHAALAQRHPELDEHSTDVASDVELLARAVGMDQEAVEQIVRAGDLHDVGKLGIPDEIIAKPGPLSERDWEFMRQHTVMGERIIAAAGPSLERIAPLVRSSHERWDGNGYPDGLAGEQIPLGARIITICDAFRAMLSERPYKRPIPLEEALEELRRCAGSQFDPRLVEVFCETVTAPTPPERLPGSTA